MADMIPADEGAPEGTPPANRPERGLYDPTAQGGRLWATFDIKSDEGYARLSEYRHGEALALAECLNQTIDVVDVIVEGASTTNPETGEVTSFPLITLIDKDGLAYRCGSTGVFDSLRDLLAWRPKTPWNPPLPVKCVAKKLGGGRRYFVLVYSPRKGGTEANNAP